jgi:hypothetical protein
MADDTHYRLFTLQMIQFRYVRVGGKYVRANDELQRSRYPQGDCDLGENPYYAPGHSFSELRVLPIAGMCNQSRNPFQPQPIFLLETGKGKAIKIQDADHSQTVWGIKDLNTGKVSLSVLAGPEISLQHDVWPFGEGARCGWTNLISTARAV